MNVTTIDDGEDNERSSKATVYLPTDKADWLDKKLDNYRDPNKDHIHGPSGYTLINDINSIDCSSIESFYRPRNEFDNIRPEERNWYELWIANLANDIIPSTYEKLRQIGIEIADKNIVFKQT